MKKLKLIINNPKKISSEYFNKKELQIILNLYAFMVSSGEWKDYGLNISKKEISFNVYRKTSEFPLYRITKNLNPENKNDKYLVKDINGKVLKKSEQLKSLIQNVKWKKLKLVN
tara:strand:- start:478 stop:819 length:342 start_codon:yes stop_codon:yes gene_type:complete